MSEIWNLPPGQRVELPLNNALQPVDKEGGIFVRFIGTVARKPHLCPIKYKTWHKVQDYYKEQCWDTIKVLNKF